MDYEKGNIKLFTTILLMNGNFTTLKLIPTRKKFILPKDLKETIREYREFIETKQQKFHRIIHFTRKNFQKIGKGPKKSRQKNPIEIKNSM